MSTQNNFSTNALHAGHDVSANGGTRAVPIYQSSSYVFKNADHAADLFSLAEPGFSTPASTIPRTTFWSKDWRPWKAGSRRW